MGRAAEAAEIAALRAALEAVEDPMLFERLGDLGTLKSIVPGRDGALEVTVAVPLPGYPYAPELERRIAEVLATSDGEPWRTERGQHSVRLALDVMDDPARSSLALRLRELEKDPAAAGDVGSSSKPGAAPAGTRPSPLGSRRSGTRIIAVASGKGGVGKSSVTVNLAVALAASGHSTALLDADIYGFSVPRMLGVEHPPVVVEKVILPPVANGVRCISMGFFVEEDAAVAWRGPMLHKALEQFLVDVHWGRPELLVVDMPPGTGDVALSVAQQLPSAELIVVTTPQPAAQRVAQRAGALARQLRLPIRGVVENMSYFDAPDGSRYEIFGAGGGELLATSLGVPLLCRIPLVEAVRAGADDGRPAAVADPGGPVATAFEELAARIVEMGPARVYRSELSVS